jgi:hypothetical protein
VGVGVVDEAAAASLPSAPAIWGEALEYHYSAGQMPRLVVVPGDRVGVGFTVVKCLVLEDGVRMCV